MHASRANTSVVGIAASKALPSGSSETTIRVLGGVHHYAAVPAHGYPGSVTGTVRAADDILPTAYSEPRVIRSRNGVLHVTFKAP
jgi:hypothetical protein